MITTRTWHGTPQATTKCSKTLQLISDSVPLSLVRILFRCPLALTSYFALPCGSSPLRESWAISEELAHGPVRERTGA